MADEYARSLLKASTAIICKELGHVEVEENALDALSEIMQFCNPIHAFPFTV